MTRTSRILIAAAALLLSATYFLPLWEIWLDAPQYPEGLGMEIWINQIQGQNEGDLSKINNLNHYIGMKRIVPESIPELTLMPWIMRGLMLFGLLTALLGKRGLLLVWLMLFLLLSVAGLVDFYLWGYDYGHNLDTENAIIKIPGMSYQPPVLGVKKLLNFTAISLPGLGAIALMIAMVIGAAVWWIEWRRATAGTRKGRVHTAAAAAGCLLASLSVFSCGQTGPVPLVYGTDQCDYCRMTIAEARFGAELITATGRILRFDSIECLAAADRQRRQKNEQAKSSWVTDFHEPGSFLSTEEAVLVLADRMKSPMGIGLVAVRTSEAADRLIGEAGGQVVTWVEVMDHVAEAWKLP